MGLERAPSRVRGMMRGIGRVWHAARRDGGNGPLQVSEDGGQRMTIDRAESAGFLRRRRPALQPEDAGPVCGVRRGTSGLRREEAALLCNMSADCYAKLERERGPQPSERLIASIARGLRLSLDERDHLFRPAGSTAPGTARRPSRTERAADRRWPEAQVRAHASAHGRSRCLSRAGAITGPPGRSRGRSHRVVRRTVPASAVRTASGLIGRLAYSCQL